MLDFTIGMVCVHGESGIREIVKVVLGIGGSKEWVSVTVARGVLTIGVALVARVDDFPVRLGRIVTPVLTAIAVELIDKLDSDRLGNGNVVTPVTTDGRPLRDNVTSAELDCTVIADTDELPGTTWLVTVGCTGGTGAGLVLDAGVALAAGGAPRD